MITFNDITVQWGTQPDQLDRNMARWRQAVFQDVAITGDHRFMIFVYDPVADENSGTSGPRKGPPSLIIFDTNVRKFVREIPLPLREYEEGILKFGWLIDDLPTGRASMALVTEQSQYGQKKLVFWSVRLTPDGMNLQGAPVQLFGPLPIGEDYIVNNRDDVAELVLITGPGMTVWRIDARMPSQQPIDSFMVAGGDLRNFYDAFIWRGKVYFLAQRPHDETFDFGTISILDLNARGSPLRIQPLSPDPMRGFPPNRRQAGLAMYMGRIYLVGGEIQQANEEWFRFQDAWEVSTGDWRWQQIQCTIPLPLIEPRLTPSTGGKLYVWGDCDLPSGCVAPPTHSHIIIMDGASQTAPPPYEEATAPPPAYGAPSSQPSFAPYTQASAPEKPPSAPQYPSYSGGGQAPYPQQGQAPYPQQGQPTYPQQGYAQPQYPQGGYAPAPGPGQMYGQNPSGDKKKDCCLM